MNLMDVITRRSIVCILMFFIVVFTIVTAIAIKGVLPTNRTRTYFCDRSLQVHNGSLPYRRALEGMNVTVAIHMNTPAIMMLVSNVTGKPTGGFMYELQLIVSQKGNFTFNYVLVPNLPSSYTTTTWLKTILPFVDIYANNWYSDTADRRASGIGFTRKVVDASLILVTYQTNGHHDTNVFNFLTPFTSNLWLCICGVIVMNGIFHWLINQTKHKDRQQSVTRSIYLSFAAFAHVDNINPRDYGGMILNTGYSFFLLIIISAYTANLAVVLVSNNAQVATTIHSIDDANAQGARICALKGNTALTVIQASYQRIQAVAATTNQIPVLLQMVRNGTCDGAVLGENDWNYAVQNSHSNPDCGMVAVGSPFRIINGAWPYLSDFSVRCTSLVETVISKILIEMYQDGSLQNLYSSYVSQSSDLTCSGIPSTVAPFATLQIADLAGIFITYAIAAIIAIILFLLDRVISLPAVKNRIELAKTSVCYIQLLMERVKACLGATVACEMAFSSSKYRINIVQDNNSTTAAVKSIDAAAASIVDVDIGDHKINLAANLEVRRSSAADEEHRICFNDSEHLQSEPPIYPAKWSCFNCSDEEAQEILPENCLTQLFV